MTLGRHGGDAQRAHVVADIGRLTGRVGDIHVVVEDTHGKRGLRQFAVGHEAVGLESFVLRRAHTGKIDGVLGAPVVLLQIAQVVGHHGDIRAPLFL